jgi:hypothetical protein
VRGFIDVQHLLQATNAALQALGQVRHGLLERGIELELGVTVPPTR